VKRSLFTAAACFAAAAWVAACSDSNGTGESPFATTIQMIGGDQQEGLPGAALADSLVVRVVDGHGNGVGGVSVKFVVTSGGGSVSPANATTNADGYAAAEWVLGRTFDAQTVEARAGGLDGSPVEFTAQMIEPSAVAVGDTVLGIIETEGEVDIYTFTGTEGQEINIFIQPLPASDAMVLEVYADYGTPTQQLLGASFALPTNDLLDNHTRRIPLPADGDYTIVVRGQAPEYVGPYRFYIFQIDRNPEWIASTVAIGDTIDGESISPKGDVDVFTFTGTAGQVINVYFQAGQGTDGFHLRVVERYGTPDARLIGITSGSGTSDPDWDQTGRVELSHDGTYAIMVWDLNENNEGPYRFYISSIDHDPESVPATVAIGDTIEGEGIYPKGDVDEFTFVGEAGQQVDIYVQSLIDCCDNFLFRVYDRYGTAEQTLLGEIFAYPTDSLEQLAISGLTLPRDDVYTIVVAGNWSNVTGPYRFHIRPRH
jgi:hypothetical protein